MNRHDKSLLNDTQVLLSKERQRMDNIIQNILPELDKEKAKLTQRKLEQWELKKYICELSNEHHVNFDFDDYIFSVVTKEETRPFNQKQTLPINQMSALLETSQKVVLEINSKIKVGLSTDAISIKSKNHDNETTHYLVIHCLENDIQYAKRMNRSNEFKTIVEKITVYKNIVKECEGMIDILTQRLKRLQNSNNS